MTDESLVDHDLWGDHHDDGFVDELFRSEQTAWPIPGVHKRNPIDLPAKRAHPGKELLFRRQLQVYFLRSREERKDTKAHRTEPRFESHCCVMVFNQLCALLLL